MSTFYPNRLLDLTIDVNAAIGDVAVVERLAPSASAEAVITSVRVASDTLEVLVVLSTGHLLLFRHRQPVTLASPMPSLDPEIIMLEHERKKARLWIPDISEVWSFFSPQATSSPELDRDDDEDPGAHRCLVFHASQADCERRRRAVYGRGRS